VVNSIWSNGLALERNPAPPYRTAKLWIVGRALEAEAWNFHLLWLVRGPKGPGHGFTYYLSSLLLWLMLFLFSYPFPLFFFLFLFPFLFHCSRRGGSVSLLRAYYRSRPCHAYMLFVHVTPLRINMYVTSVYFTFALLFLTSISITCRLAE
jgi:hypothetical protein